MPAAATGATVGDAAGAAALSTGADVVVAGTLAPADCAGAAAKTGACVGAAATGCTAVCMGCCTGAGAMVCWGGGSRPNGAATGAGTGAAAV